MTIRVVKPGLLTTVQDLGRYGYAHLGISSGGAADPLSFRIANLLVGNRENAPALEMTLLGATLEFGESAVVALAGADCECKSGSAEDRPTQRSKFPRVPSYNVGTSPAACDATSRCKVGFEVPLVMGSASTFVPGHFGGFNGRRLQSGRHPPGEAT